MEIIFDANKRHVNQIKNWLHDEKMQGEVDYYSSFYGQIHILAKNNFVCLVVDGEAISYINYQLSSDRQECLIELACTKKEYRGKGYGKILLNTLIEELKLKGCVLMYLYCSPASSQKVWRKMDFQKFNSGDSKIWMYKPLVDILKPTKKKDLPKSYIALWKSEGVNKIEHPDFVWNLASLKKPIIYPADDRWKLKYVKDGVTISEREVYYSSFAKTDSLKFIIIQSL